MRNDYCQTEFKIVLKHNTIFCNEQEVYDNMTNTHRERCKGPMGVITGRERGSLGQNSIQIDKNAEGIHCVSFI